MTFSRQILTHSNIMRAGMARLTTSVGAEGIALEPDRSALLTDDPVRKRR